MKKISKLIVLALVLSMLVSMLTGCGKNIDGKYYKYDGKSYDTSTYYVIKGSKVEFVQDNKTITGTCTSLNHYNNKETIIFTWDSDGHHSTLDYYWDESSMKQGNGVEFKKK